MQDHTLSSFDAQLNELHGAVRETARLSREAVGGAFQALLAEDGEKARLIIASDAAIDAGQSRVEDLAVLTIARNQPMAVDLREIVATIRIANDLERIGDLAKNIAKRTVALSATRHDAQLLTGIARLTELVETQLKRVLDAYEVRDSDAAIEVRLRDRDIDALHTSVFRELLTYMLEDPRNINVCTHLLFCAKNIERIGDHATNIAETVHFIRTGEIMDDDRPKADESSGAGL